MPPSPANPDGYYEDMPLVALHDDLLRNRNTDWQFTGEVDLSANAGLDVIQRYVSLRDSLHGEHWGMKDPRQCLFLPNWQQVLGGRGRYLVVLRHWGASIQSLLKRSSRDLALGVGFPGYDGRFWREPGYAARMWIAYNEKLLAFLEVCPLEQCLVVTQQALMQGLELPRRVSEHFIVPLDVKKPSPIKPGLVHDEVAESVQLHLTDMQVERMNELWTQLLHYANHRVDRESPTWRPDSYTLRDRSLSDSLLSASPFTKKHQATAQKGGAPKNDESLALKSSFEELSKRARREYRALQLTDAERHTREALELNPRAAPEYVRLACILLVSGKAQEAEALLSSAIDRLGEVAILLQYRATVLDLLERTEEAVALLAKAGDSSELLARLRVSLLLKSDSSEGLAEFRVWSKQRSSSPKAWQQVSNSLKAIEIDMLRKDFALRVAKIWSDLA